LAPEEPRASSERMFRTAAKRCTVVGMDVAERIRTRGESLTAAERRVAAAILDAPQAVAFGTVADLARAANVGAASVVRLATKLGFEGYSDLQESIQHDLTRQLRPAAERIHEDVDERRSEHLAAELANVRSSVEAVGEDDLQRTVSRLADLDRPVAVLSGEASAGVAAQFVGQLQQLRSGVCLLGGSDVAVRREVAVLPVSASVVVVDLRRYERWVLDAHADLHARGVWSAALTDSMLSPIASKAEVTFVVSAGAVGPFDSHVGTLAVLELHANGVAAELRSSAADRLAAIEAAWTAHGSLTAAE
jgi:DNA-binding MurR/RpiR family transcriptional regulator